MRHQKRARNGCRSHHQHVGAAVAAFGLQGKPLVHAKAVLLVDDGNARSRNFTSSWNNACVPMRMSISPAASRAKIFFARLALLASGEQPDPQGPLLLANGSMVSEMLPRQHFRRRHQRRLRARLPLRSPSPISATTVLPEPTPPWRRRSMRSRCPPCPRRSRRAPSLLRAGERER